MSCGIIQEELSWANNCVKTKMGKKTRSWTSSVCAAFFVSVVIFPEIVEGLNKFNGKYIGALTSYAHKVSGTVYAVNQDTLFIKDFTYDGLAPDTNFWIGTSGEPSVLGTLVPYPNNYTQTKPPVLQDFYKENLTLHLPPGHKLKDITWLAVLCKRFTVYFGHVMIPNNLEIPDTNPLILKNQNIPPSLDDNKETPSPTKHWPINRIKGVTNFTARLGPDGGNGGYTSITGRRSWGIAWYINDQLIPEIYVERGKTYQFWVEGGNDPKSPFKYHPLYITDSIEGGYGQKITPSQETVYAGVTIYSAEYSYATAAGRHCEWEHKTTDQSAESETFQDFLKTLDLVCDDGRPSLLTWTVPYDAPDILYYQCYTHYNLGWKIFVLNPGESNRSTQNSMESSSSKLWGTLNVLLLPLILVIRRERM